VKGTLWRTLLVLEVCAACTPSGEAPFDQLALRHALRADPEALAELDRTELETLADRLEDARRAQRVRDTQPRTNASDAIGHAIAYDERREGAGEDALIALEVEVDTRQTAIATLEIPPDGGIPIAPELTTEDPTLSEEPYASVIASGAREALLDIAAQSGAYELRAARNVPFGVLADGDTLHVNLAWLVAMSSRDEGMTTDIGRASSALDRNPYELYPSLDQCVSDVNGACVDCLTVAQCSGEPNLEDFSTVQQECTFLAADPDLPALLCIIGMMSIHSVSSCVRRTEPDCPGVEISPVAASLESARPFLARAECIAALEACAQDRAPVVSSGGSDCDAGCDSPDCALNCGDAFSGCSACADATSSTATSCNDTCDSSCDTCSSSSSDCDLCAVVPEGSSRRSSPLALVFLAAPLVYLFGVGRRR
jgi:hypothetical protein